MPFSCALTAGLAGSGRATLMQEFGLCTAAPGACRAHHSSTISWAQPRPQYLASEEEAAEYYDAVLERLVATGAAGAYAWCYGDYDSRLFDRPPLATAMRERTFGLVRADGSEKPAAGVFRQLQETSRCRGTACGAAQSLESLDVSADEYYRAPGRPTSSGSTRAGRRTHA